MKWVVTECEAAIVVHASKPLRHNRSEESDEVENALGIRVGQDNIAQVVRSCYILAGVMWVKKD